MPWTTDLLIEYCSYRRVTKLSLIGIVRAIDVRDCLVIEIVQTIDFGDCLLIGFVRTAVFGDCLLIGIVWTIHVWYFVTIGAARSNDFGVSLLIGIVVSMDFRYCPIIWIAWTNWCLVLSINWNCPDKWSRRLSIGIVLKIVFTGCL